MAATINNQPRIELRTHHATWQLRHGDKFTDTEVRAGFDARNHLRLVITPSDKSYRAILQVIGEPPRLLRRGRLNHAPAASDPQGIDLFCLRSTTNTDGPAFDSPSMPRRLLKEEP